jgi:putative ABC transport system permease protein
MTRARSLGFHRPFVLLQFPPLFAAIAAAAAILAAAAAAAPLFRSSTGAAAVQIAIGERAGTALVISQDAPLAADILDLRDRQIRLATSGLEDLAAPTETLYGSSVTVLGGVQSRLATRTGFASHARILAGDAQAHGLWLPEDVAAVTDVTVGDLETVSLRGRRMQVPVAGVYSASRDDPYWSAVFSTVGGEREPSALVMIDRAGFLRVETELEDTGRQTWTFPLATGAVRGLTLDGAATLADGITALERASKDPTTQLGSVLASPAVSSPIVEAVRAAEAGERTITAPIQTLALTGELVAMFGMLAAGVYGVRRRRIEMRWLDAKGITWSALWIRSATEGALPILVGVAAGWLFTWLAIRRFGPSDVIEPAALRSSIVVAAVPSVFAVVVLGVVTALSARRQAHEGARGTEPLRSGATLLWEVPVLVLAAAALYEIWTRGTSAVSFEGGEVQVDRLLLLFPVLFMAGCAGLVVRGMARLLLRVRGSERLPVSLYLASRRVSTAPRVALLLVTASTLAIGVLAYAGTAVATIRTSTRDKVLVSSGADVTAQTPGPIFPPAPGSGLSTTNVMTVPYVAAGTSGETQVTLIGVEPDTFAETAFWDPSFSSRSLAELMHDLGGVASEPMPAIVVGGDLAEADRRLNLAGYQLPLDVVGTASAFPGHGSGLAVVVSAPALRTVLHEHDAGVALNGARYQAWASGRAGLARGFLVSSGADPNSFVVASERLQTPGFRALAWSFVFMELVGVVTAVIALIGLLLYLQARQRSRELSYALGRRMGLSSGAHRLAVAAEIAGLLASAYVMGSVLAITTALLVYRRLDPLPQLPPAPVLHTPLRLLAWIGVAIAACAWLGAWFVQRRAERADVGAVLRFAE